MPQTSRATVITVTSGRMAERVAVWVEIIATIVHCVKMKIGSEDTGYVTEYRAFKKPLEISEDRFFSPESLIEELESMCVPQWEHEATIYEL